jgi:hypothetical protein
MSKEEEQALLAGEAQRGVDAISVFEPGQLAGDAVPEAGGVAPRAIPAWKRRSMDR